MHSAMLPLLFFLLLIQLPSLHTLDCYCSGCGGAKYCTGDYCYQRKPDPNYADKIDTGCLTPREDVWKDKTLPLCEKNQYNATFCLCNNGDLCNTIDKFSSIHEKEDYFIPKLMDCINNGTADYYTMPPCSSSLCVFSEDRDYDEFLDLTNPPFHKAERRCPTYETWNVFSIDIRNTAPQMNSCLHIRWRPTMSTITCSCNTPKCNSKIPMFNITKRGKGKCYLKTKETETMTCWGDYCFWEGGDNRGCLDASAADPNFKLRLGESTLDDEYFTICEGDYCNSDILFPNGTIVGPSAIRKFRASVAKSISLTSLFIVSFVKLLM